MPGVLAFSKNLAYIIGDKKRIIQNYFSLSLDNTNFTVDPGWVSLGRMHSRT
jgi:hypothetical protein